MNPTRLLPLLAGSIMLLACDSPTAPTGPKVFPYAGCKMIQAGTTTNGTTGKLEDIWQQWHCDDGRYWQVSGDGSVFAYTP